MLCFENDYSQGAHPVLLKRLTETNMEALPGYGSDDYCMSAREKIRIACNCPEAQVFFLVGGTQTNAVVIGSLLKRYQGVLAAATGHVATHEAGAIEYTGHKVLELPQKEGKIAAGDLKKYLEGFYGDANHDHMVFPGMVYLSHPTEYGTLYSRQELADISEVCHRFEIPLYMDGARLGYALACPESDLSLEDIARYTDVFYIGGTKVGALCGEALVFPRRAPEHFLTLVKQQGALLAKGRLLGVQFDALFTDELYVKIAGNAIETAGELRGILQRKGYRLLGDSPTNQIFVILANDKKKQLEKKVKFSFWETYDESHTVVRFATSWATQMEEVKELEALL